MTQQAAVIGAGIGGIAAAIRLAAKGYRVTVYEQAAGPGGKISEWRSQGFRFDTGPSLFTLPQLVDELYELLGEQPQEHFQYNKLAIITRYFYADGSVINAYGNEEAFADEVNQHTTDTGTTLKRYLQKARELYELTAQVFIFRPFNFSTFTSAPARKAALRLHKLDSMRSLHAANAAHFSDKRLVQLFDRYATYNGSNPYKTPATLKVISHLEHSIGAFFPKKGMFAIVHELVQLAERHGVSFQYNSKVTQVQLQNKRATHVVVNGQPQPVDYVVSDTDIFHFYAHLVPGYSIPKKQSRQELSTSALIFYWGVNGHYPELDLHNILFAEDYRAEFQALESGRLYHDPTVYIFISSKTVPGDAPEGSENWFVMINVPPDNDQDWQKWQAQARNYILQKIKTTLGRDIAPEIRTEHVLNPPDIASRTSSWRGALYGNSSNNRFAAFLRHANKSSKFQNIRFTGGSVHPGGGIPLCLASAAIATEDL